MPYWHGGLRLCAAQLLAPLRGALLGRSPHAAENLRKSPRTRSPILPAIEFLERAPGRIHAE